jgi:hypothetical protein
MEYDDGLIACSDDGVIIRRYDVFLRPKHIPYDQIRKVTQVELRGFRFGNWRLWGSTDLRHWFNLDRRRPEETRGVRPRPGRTDETGHYPGRPAASDRSPALARRLGDGALMDPTRRCRPIRVMRKSSASRKD